MQQVCGSPGCEAQPVGLAGFFYFGVYRKLDAMSLRGTETYLCQSPLSAGKFALRVYGQSTVIFTEVH